MKAIIEALWNICLMRLGPQDLPASRVLLYLVAAAYAGAGFVVNVINLPDIGLFTALLSALVDTAVLMGVTALLLWVRDLGARYVQTATALVGTGALFTVMALPLVTLQAQAAPEGNFAVAVALIALMLWNLNVVGHILRHALDTRFFIGLLLSVVYLYISISVFRAFFAPAPVT